MSLTRAVANAFSHRTRQRGALYADEGRVSIVARDDLAVDAVVQGGDDYDVGLAAGVARGTTVIHGSCTCPFVLDRLEPCKHLWAALVEAERQGWQPQDALRQTRTRFEIADPDVDSRDDMDDEVIVDHRSRELWPAYGSTRGLGSRFVDLLDQELSRADGRAGDRPTGDPLYVIDLVASREHGGLVLQIMTRHLKKSGDWSRPKPVKPSHFLPDRASPADRLVLAALAGAAGAAGPWSPPAWLDAASGANRSTFLLSDAHIVELLPTIGRSGRAFVREGPSMADLQSLRWDEDDEPWRFRPRISVTPRGFRVAGAFERPGECINVEDAALVLPAGFLIARSRMARLQPMANPALLRALGATGPLEVPKKETTRLAYGLARAEVPAAGLPEELRVIDVDVEPRPRLQLLSGRWTRTDTIDANLSFDYDGSTVPSGSEAVTFDATRRSVVRRRLESEREFLDQLSAAGFRMGWSAHGRSVLQIGAKALIPALDALLASGWHVEGHDGVRYARASGVQMAVSSGVDWFDLTATATFGDASANLTDVLAALRQKTPFVTLGDGRTGVLPADWLRRYAPLAAAADVSDNRLRFRRSQVALVDALLAARGADATLATDAGFERMRKEIGAFSGVRPVSPPRAFQGTLRPYQREGLGWFHFLRRLGLGGCLADDMGLGKTVMVLALLLWWREERGRGTMGPRPSLVVVPRSLVHNWIAEARRFTPDLAVLDYSGVGRSAHQARLDDYDVVLATYGTLRRDVVDLKDTEFEYVILDEAQAIKNAGSASAKAARLLRGRQRLTLSGTPIENHLGELWSLVEFLNPGLLGRATAFEQALGGRGTDGSTAVIARAVRPFILRRTKAQVARDLPARTEQTIRCDLSKPEQDFYDGLRRHYRDTLLARVDRVGMARSKIHVLEALLRLRQAACHVGLVDRARRADSSSKFDVLLPRLQEVVAEGHKAIVFSQFTTLLGLLKDRLDRSGPTYEYLDGRTRDRDARVQRFQNDAECPLFLISLKAGGVGLNLTAAEYVFLLDPWWNPAVEAQAIDRAHRIGQTREVFACRVIASDTVEDKVLQLQESKRALADAVLTEDAGGLRHLQREDLELLLS